MCGPALISSNCMILDIETTGLNPLEDEIIAIGFLNINEVRKSPLILSIGKNEETLLHHFWEYIEDTSPNSLIGFNFDFDWTFIKLRSLKYNLKIRNFDQRKRIDLRLLLNGFLYQKCTKLSDYARFFEFPIDDEIGGAQVPELFRQGQLNLIIKHLYSDVKLTYQIFERIEKGGLLV